MDLSQKEQQQAEFAIKCRQVRLAIAKNWGITQSQLAKLVGFDPEPCLDRLVDLGLVSQVATSKTQIKWEIIHK